MINDEKCRRLSGKTLGIRVKLNFPRVTTTRPTVSQAGRETQQSRTNERT
eukprot:gene13678-21278_t